MEYIDIFEKAAKKQRSIEACTLAVTGHPSVCNICAAVWDSIRSGISPDELMKALSVDD